MSAIGPLVRLVAAAALAAAAYAVVPAAPAAAASCGTDHGVTVVVDFHALGGGVQTACVADGGGDSASSLLPAAGFPLTYVQRQPGFVCRVKGLPDDDPCVNTPPADAYWGLFWSDGESGSWSYATTSAASLHVPDGGYVAFSWQGSDDRSAPGYRPSPHPSASPDPEPSHEPTHAPTHDPSHGPSPAPSSAPSGSTSASSPTGSASADGERGDGDGGGAGRDEKGEDPTDEPEDTGSASPTPDETEPGTPTSSPSVAAASAEPADPDGGLPGWVAPAVVAVLFGAAGAVAVVRRRRGPA